MTADECRGWRENLGALVLGQLGPDEQAATQAHLDGCPECRAEADALAPMATMLRRADPARLAAAPAPPVYLGDRIGRRIARERAATRRRRRIRIGVGAGAFAAAATAAILLAVTLSGPGRTGTSVQTVAFADTPPGVSVAATLQPRPWGTDVHLHVEGFRPGTLCTVWLRRRDGTRVPAGSFRYIYAGESDEAELGSGLDPADVRAVGLRAGSRTFVAPIRPQAQDSGRART